MTASQPQRSGPPFLEGPRLCLRALNEHDVDGPYLQWLNDERVCRGNSHHRFPYTREQAIEYVRRASDAGSDLVLAMVLREGDKHIGNIALAGLHPIYRSADFTILLGDAAEWGKGYGREAGELLLRHGFGALNLARVSCGTFATNAGMIGLARSLGMRQEGVRRQAAFKDGAYVDVIEFGILRDEFKERAGR